MSELTLYSIFLYKMKINVINMAIKQYLLLDICQLPLHALTKFSEMRNKLYVK